MPYQQPHNDPYAMPAPPHGQPWQQPAPYQPYPSPVGPGHPPHAQPYPQPQPYPQQSPVIEYVEVPVPTPLPECATLALEHLRDSVLTLCGQGAGPNTLMNRLALVQDISVALNEVKGDIDEEKKQLLALLQPSDTQ